MNIRLPIALVLSVFSLGAAAEDYTFLWWADGYRGRAADGRRLLNVQTNHYGASFDVERATLMRYGEIRDAAPYADAATQDNGVIAALPEAELRLSVLVGDTTYICTRAAADLDDHAVYPIRLIDGGRYLNRFDILGLEFTDSEGKLLDAEGRLEVAAWPEQMQFTLSLTPRISLPQGRMMVELIQLNNKFRAQHRFEAAASDTRLDVHLGWPRAEVRPDPQRVRVTTGGESPAPVPVHFDDTMGGYVVALPESSWTMAEDLDRLDRFPVGIRNDGDAPEIYSLIFSFDEPFQGVTGLCPMLRDEAGNPTGIPVQISKNWHRRPERPLLYEGPWLHAVTQITVPSGGEWKGEFCIAYARWGGVPAASHAQLCLIGWGGNQWWDQAAIGSFGESITYDPDVGLNRSMIDDVRPLMVRGMNDGQWEWTHNVGGGDFLVYFNAAGEKQYLSRVKTAYLSQGPNLKDVVYAGVSADGKIEARIQVMTPRCDDVNRAYHRVRYDVRAPVEFSRLAFYQLGADNYNDHQFTTIARGNNAGLTEEWQTELGGKRYLRDAMPCEGDAPWLALLGGIRSPQLTKGAWADRALVIRSWKSRLGGQDVPLPHAAVYGTENGPASANVELVPPPGVTTLEVGDFVEAEIELLILPQQAEDYYGPNEALRADLKENGGTWRVAHRLAKGNDLQIKMERGTLSRRLPIEVNADEQETAGCTITGGVGYVPISFTGLSRAEGYVLEVDGTPVNQSVHGNDFWQVVRSGNQYSRTYNILMDGASERQVSFRKE